MTPLVVVPGLSLAPRHGAHSARRPSPAAGQPIPLPDLPTRHTPHTVYGLSIMDRYGRVADRAVLRALGWTPGLALALSMVSDSVLAVADPHAAVRVGTDGHLRLPVGLRRGCGLSPGNQLLLVADPPAGRLLLHPPAALDALLLAHRTAILVGATT